MTSIKTPGTPKDPVGVIPTPQDPFTTDDQALAVGDCVWAGKTYSEGGVHTEGGVSYTCTAGKWVKG